MLATYTAHVARTAAQNDHSGLICTILLIAALIALVVGLAELLGLNIVGDRIGGRFSALVVAVVLLIVYFVLC